jgi:hypothetical protein
VPSRRLCAAAPHRAEGSPAPINVSDDCDLLLVANRDNPKALGDFRYEVDDRPKAKAKTKPTT